MALLGIIEFLCKTEQNTLQPRSAVSHHGGPVVIGATKHPRRVSLTWGKITNAKESRGVMEFYGVNVMHELIILCMNS